ncbi:hypothetical protein GCM10023205_04180 [Yinghuangia aomiensis]|uniref:DNA helicase DnaB-like N-terminal domain-containing protein n=1 Tax=Yinghuangia aomiensis TaxID=676205 RepID=A0ABP9GNT3_9ACTN
MEEEMVLRSLAAAPAGLADVDWLTPDDFAHPTHAALFACLRALDRRGERIDPVTLLWEAHTAGYLAGLRLDAHRVTELLAGGTGISAAYEARQVLRHALLRRTHQCAAQIADMAAQARLPAHHLAAAAARALDPADALRRRWHTSHTPDATPRGCTRPASARPRSPTAPPSKIPAVAHPTAHR